jgi:hypothetical protein
VGTLAFSIALLLWGRGWGLLGGRIVPLSVPLRSGRHDHPSAELPR